MTKLMEQNYQVFPSKTCGWLSNNASCKCALMANSWKEVQICKKNASLVITECYARIMLQNPTMNSCLKNKILFNAVKWYYHENKLWFKMFKHMFLLVEHRSVLSLESYFIFYLKKPSLYLAFLDSINIFLTGKNRSEDMLWGVANQISSLNLNLYIGLVYIMTFFN